MGTVTDQYIGNDIIYRTLENGNADANIAGPTPLITDMFSVTEILDSMNRIQQQFLLATGLVLTRATIPGAIGQPTYDLPVDNILARRVTWTQPNGGWNTGGWNTDPWNNGSGMTTMMLTKCDTWELDNAQPDWPYDTSSVPVAWWDTTLPQQQIGIAKTPANTGTIGLLYVALAAQLDNTGVALTVPDDWSPYILWGTLAELLGSDGPSFDPVRAKWCKQRMDEGIELANLVLGGS